MRGRGMNVSEVHQKRNVAASIEYDLGGGGGRGSGLSWNTTNKTHALQVK